MHVTRRGGGDHSISKRLDDPTLRVLSLGAGVQSSVLALLATRGKVGDVPDAAIFADTQWEPPRVYEHLDWLETQLSFPVYRVTAGNIVDHIKYSVGPKGKRFSSIPWFVKESNNQTEGMGRRQCTREFKIDPIRKKVRELLGLKPRQRAKDLTAEMWIGISTDEIQRLKESRFPYMKNRWPLIEMRWSRGRCISWFEGEYPGQPLSKSSCIGCPYRKSSEWARMKIDDPENFEDAVRVDHMLRERGPARGMAPLQYMHRSCRPLDEVDFSQWTDQMEFGFLNECEGICGI